jgi:hypothetical protein
VSDEVELDKATLHEVLTFLKRQERFACCWDGSAGKFNDGNLVQYKPLEEFLLEKLRQK